MTTAAEPAPRIRRPLLFILPCLASRPRSFSVSVSVLGSVLVFVFIFVFESCRSLSYSPDGYELLHYTLIREDPFLTPSAEYP